MVQHQPVGRTIVWVNAAFTKLTGYIAEEAVGRSHRILSSGQHDQAFYRELWETIGHGEIWRGELVNRRKDGTLYHEEMGITPLRDETGKITHYLAVKQDITERKAVQERLEREKALADSIISSMPGVFYMLDERMRLMRWNTNLEHLLGYSAGELRLRPALDLVAPEDHALTKARFRVALETGEAEAELRLLTKEGRHIPFLFTGRRFRFNDQVGVAGIGLDISERKCVEDALLEAGLKLAAANAELEQKVHARTAALEETVAEIEHFSYTLTHDMRAPLRAMQGLGSILIQECGDCLQPVRQEYLRRIVDAAERMDRLITDALQYSGVVRQEFKLETVDIKALLKGMLETYPQFQPEHANIEIARELPPEVGNKAALTQIFSNLITNALKFVQRGKQPRVRIWAEAINRPATKWGSADWVRLWVKDEGIGIEREYQDEIWAMFQWLNKSYEGTGIGLALVRKAVQRIGGRVGVESDPGQGSRFWVELPRATTVKETHEDTPLRGG